MRQKSVTGSSPSERLVKTIRRARKAFQAAEEGAVERALGAELTHHLGYEKGDPAGRGTGNGQ
jgi:transposase-like protein